MASLILGFLASLGPEFHHEEHEPVNTNHKHNNNTCIPPPVILLCEVQCTKVISTLSVLAHLTAGDVVGVEEIRACPQVARVDVKVFATGLIGGWVKYSQFRRVTINMLFPGSEDENGTHKVVKGVDVVHPVVVEDGC